MPKKGKSSIGRKFKGQSKETKYPFWSENEGGEARGSFIDVEASSYRMEKSAVEESAYEERVQMDQGGLRADQDLDLQENDLANPEMNENEGQAAFENNLDKCSKREKQSARAFQKLGIESEYEWPEDNETKDDS